MTRLCLEIIYILSKKKFCLAVPSLPALAALLHLRLHSVSVLSGLFRQIPWCTSPMSTVGNDTARAGDSDPRMKPLTPSRHDLRDAPDTKGKKQQQTPSSADAAPSVGAAEGRGGGASAKASAAAASAEAAVRQVAHPTKDVAHTSEHSPPRLKLSFATAAASGKPVQRNLLPMGYPLPRPTKVRIIQVKRRSAVTVTTTVAGVHRVLRHASLNDDERSTLRELPGAPQHAAALRIRVADDTRGMALVTSINEILRGHVDASEDAGGRPSKKATDEQQPKGIIGIASMDPVDDNGITVHLRPPLRRRGNAWSCAILPEEDADCWPIALYSLMNRERLLTEHGAGIAFHSDQAGPWLSGVVTTGKYNELAAWCHRRRVALRCASPPRMWAVHFTAARQERLTCERIDDLRDAIGDSATGWGMPEYIDLDGKSVVRITFEAADGWAPPDETIRLQDAEGDTDVVFLAPRPREGAEDELKAARAPVPAAKPKNIPHPTTITPRLAPPPVIRSPPPRATPNGRKRPRPASPSDAIVIGSDSASESDEVCLGDLPVDGLEASPPTATTGDGARQHPPARPATTTSNLPTAGSTTSTTRRSAAEAEAEFPPLPPPTSHAANGRPLAGAPSTGRYPYYAVAAGHGGPQIYNDWEGASRAVRGYKQADFKGFHSRGDAEAFLAAAAQRPRRTASRTSAATTSADSVHSVSVHQSPDVAVDGVEGSTTQ
jgi:hypothetical protein